MRRPAPLPTEPAAARPAAPADSGHGQRRALSKPDAATPEPRAAHAAAHIAATQRTTEPPATEPQTPDAQETVEIVPLTDAHSEAVAAPIAPTPDAVRGAARPVPLAPLPVRPEPDSTTHDPADGEDLAGVGDGAEADRAALPESISVREVWAAARARRKALRAEVRRFTLRQRRRRMVWIGVVSAFVLLALGTLGAAYSPLLAVDRITVVGTESLEAGTVEAALSDQLGTPLARVDSSAIKAALVQFPLVESYVLEARPPHELVVRIVERTPIGSVESAAGFTLVDAAGVALATTPEADAGHPVITAAGGVGSAAFTAIGTVYRSLPEDIRDQVTAMSATTANDVTLTFGGTGTEVVWGNADDSAYKAVVLASAMTARPPDQVYSYDVSSPSAVVIR